MHEIITVSVGQRSNHLSTQFFNCQEQILYSQTEKLNDPCVFLDPSFDRRTKTVSYFPRALLWDARTGNGALGTYQYAQTNDYYYNENSDDNSRQNHIITDPPIPKSDYQVALDSNTGKLPELKPETTKYWSDYSKLIYHPTSFNVLKDWYHDVSNPNVPGFQNLGIKKFVDYNLGYQEFNDNYLQDFFDGNMHSQLEQCDTLQGFNLLTDMDSSWGGFSSAMLLELRNELPKVSIFTWGFNEDDPLTTKNPRQGDRKLTRATLPLVENKIRSSVNLSEESDLVISLYANPQLTNWEQAGSTCKVLDTMNSVFSQSNEAQRKSMDFVKNCLTLSDTRRNFVSSIIADEKNDYSFFARFMPGKDEHLDAHIFSKCLISRGDSKLSSSSKETPSYIKELSSYAYQPSDTIPTQFSKVTDFTLSLSSTEACRTAFLQWHDVTSKYLRYAPDREELKESLATMAARYEHGWYDDPDSGDDDV